VPLRARLAVLLAATFAVAAAFVLIVVQRDDEPRAQARFEGSIRPPGIPPSDFRMRDQDGKVATLSEYRGKPVVVTFLYTTCEDTCPLTAQQIRGALDELGRDVPVLVFAVDPPRDTPERARRFLAEQRITGRMRFLLGPEAELRRQWRAYGIQPQTESLEHSAYVVVLDGKGRQRIGFPAGQVTPSALANDIALLEREA
jgi:protein SCO1/2